MAWKDIVPSSGWTIDQWRDYVARTKFRAWRPSGLALHNTGWPGIEEWDSYPEAQRIQNLVRYYAVEQGWSTGPHAFLDGSMPHPIWPFTPITMPGTHSRGYNATRLGIELVGNFIEGVDNPRIGRGLQVYQTAVAVFASLCAKLGLEPNGETIKFHRQDPLTTHRCPGDLLYAMKDEFIQDVLEYMAEGGDHSVKENPLAELPMAPPEQRSPPEGVVNTDSLNLRDGSSASSLVLASLPLGQRVAKLGEAMNGNTRWMRVWLRDKTGTARTGWVAARFVTMD